MATLKDLHAVLPYSLRGRLQSISAFVRVIVDTLETDVPKKNRIDAAQRDKITTLVFASSVRFILQEGAAAAKASVDAFSQLGEPEFRIGSTVFSKTSEATFLGDRLAAGIDNILQGNVADSDLVPVTESLTALIEDLWRRETNG